MDHRGEGRRGSFGGFALAALLTAALAGCSGDTSSLSKQASQSCMQCHNASLKNDYAGPGIENPHPFPGADNILCTVCHGGNGNGSDKVASHIPPPPQIGDDQQMEVDRKAYFNRLTLTGIDKFDDYTVGNTTYTALDYLQFINPGDLRVVTQGRGCGQCHQGHGDVVARSLLATEAGILSGATFAAGEQNAVPESVGLFDDTAADLGFRSVTDPGYQVALAAMGAVGRLLEFPVISQHGQIGPGQLHQSNEYSAAGLADDRDLATNSVITGSPLADLYREQIAFTCGDCHLGSAGANNRYGDFRSSGCSACHMPKSLSGRAGSSDPNIDKLEPLDPDDIDEPELPHLRSHRIISVAKTLPSGVQVQGMDDYTCAGCHQGSNRTVMQYWGIRLDQNADVKNNRQYPANPADYQTTFGDTRLFDPDVGNKTFNGRNHNQYLVFEDYDGDGRDDTPEDVHYAAGLGCIDCHGSHDLHGGDPQNPDLTIASRMEQAVAIACESCHGAADAYAATVPGQTYDGAPANLAVDTEGNPLQHVVREPSGEYWLTSRLTGQRHYVPQTLDTVVDSGVQHPVTQAPIYSAQASYAMGRADGNASTGLGPQQTGGVTPGFSHTDRMDCASCHSSWTNTCQGCHLEGEYSTNNNNFSNITGDRIVFREKDAEFVYQSPVYFQLGVGPRDKISSFSPNSKAFFKYEDKDNLDSQVFAFSDRRGMGNNPGTPYPAMSHNALMAHSIRGKVEPAKEGPRYCVACHLTVEGMATWGAEYNALRSALATGNYAALNFPLLRSHIGQNTGNQLGSPLWVHGVAGLGTGLFTFDEDGCAVNPLDTFANRPGCNGVSPAAAYDPARIHFDLDRIVGANGVSNASNNHPLLSGQPSALRDGALDPTMAGPLGATLLQRLTDPSTGIVLDSWIDADGQPRGNAGGFLQGP